MTTTDQTAPAARQRSHHPSKERSHQATPQPPEPTHRIVTPPSHRPDHTTPKSKEWEPRRLSSRIGDAFAGLRFVNESPGSLMDQIEYAEDGAYSNRVGGPWRTANIAYARCIAVPGLAICYFLGWAFFTRLSRAITVLIVSVPLLALLNDVPVVEWLVPDWADITTWF